MAPNTTEITVVIIPMTVNSGILKVPAKITNVIPIVTDHTLIIFNNLLFLLLISLVYIIN